MRLARAGRGENARATTMAEYLEIHPVTPQPRLIHRAAAVLQDEGIIAYPTDTCYALGCSVGNKEGLERISRIRGMDPHHRFTLICRDLSESATYAVFDTPVYRLLKAHTPGPYAFVLRASKETPRRLLDPKRKTIGMRVPDHPIAHALLEELGAPMMTSSLILPGDEEPLTDPQEIRRRLDHELDLIIDGGICGSVPTTVVDLTEETPRIIRKGKGAPEPFLA
jgi:tRNA threonylcarbamoyl adenosine modification protein (Sua5/YciO/YrdC/YwlC family)